MSNDLIPTKDDLSIIQTLTKYAVDSKYFEKLGGAGGVMSIMLYAKELGICPMTALFGGMRNVQGKIEVSPQQMNAMIRRAGHKIIEVELTNSSCTLKGVRKDTGETINVTYTIEDAKRAGIYKDGGGWTKYPQDMLFARAITRIGRRLFADVIGTMYVAGEVDEVEEATVLDEEESRPPLISNIEAEIIDVKPKASISMDEALSAIAGVHGIENDAFLRQYIEDAMSKSKLMTLDALTKAWCENKDRFINAYNARKEKLEASKDEKITS
jgi:hypothetical protein